MDKEKKVIIAILLILSVLLIIVIFGLIFAITIKNQEEISELPEIIDTDEDLFYKELIKDEQEKKLPVDNSVDFYTTELCVQKYINYIGEKNTQVLEDILWYGENNKVQTTEAMNNIGLNTKFYARKMNVYKKDYLEIYSVYGNLQKENEEGFGEELYVVVFIDKQNATYAIDSLEDQKITDIDDIEFSDYNVEIIQQNENNKLESTWLKEKEIIKEYIEYYKKMVRYNVEESYNLLDKEYAKKRFNGIEDYKNYLKQNVDDIYNIELTKYKISYEDGKERYIIVDQKDNYYIIKQSSIMQFTIMLDTYTIETTEFIERYTTATDQTKVGMNIENIISAINGKDYKYIYNKLDQTFRSNNYPTVKDLQTYIENNFFENNNIEYLDFSQEGDIYIYEIKIKEKATSTEGKSFNIIMQLNEGTDFVMSFGEV